MNIRKLLTLALAVMLAATLGAGVLAEAAPEATAASGIQMGLGHSVNFRFGPGKDDTDTQVYSFNIVMASVAFDAEGRILSAYTDIFEVATPNYDSATMPTFPGWPLTEGYNQFDAATGKVSGKADTSEEAVEAAVNGWKTKRERGDDYHMAENSSIKAEWYSQMAYLEQNVLKGKTVAELEEWVAKYASDRNGRPLNPATDNEEDKAKVDALTDEDRAMLADVVSGATMSLNDAHGNILAAVKNAYENRVPVN